MLETLAQKRITTAIELCALASFLIVFSWCGVVSAQDDSFGGYSGGDSADGQYRHNPFEYCYIDPVTKKRCYVYRESKSSSYKDDTIEWVKKEQLEYTFETNELNRQKNHKGSGHVWYDETRYQFSLVDKEIEGHRIEDGRWLRLNKAKAVAISDQFRDTWNVAKLESDIADKDYEGYLTIDVQIGSMVPSAQSPKGKLFIDFTSSSSSNIWDLKHTVEINPEDGTPRITGSGRERGDIFVYSGLEGASLWSTPLIKTYPDLEFIYPGVYQELFHLNSGGKWYNEQESFKKAESFSSKFLFYPFTTEYMTHEENYTPW